MQPFLQDQEDKRTEARVGDALAGVRSDPQVGGDMVGRSESQTLLDHLWSHPGIMTPNVGPGSINVSVTFEEHRVMALSHCSASRTP